MQVFQKLFKGREQVILALLVVLVSTVAAALLYYSDRYAFLYFGDAAAHIVKARQFFDSQRTGIENLGTVWLPLPHLMLIPAVTFDGIFYSGFAGPVIGIPCLVFTALLLYRIIMDLTKSSGIAFFMASLFSLNPNVLYMAFTPMSEPALIFFVTLAGYSFHRWLRSGREKWMLLCSISVLMASMCRYEGWVLVPFVSLIAFLQMVSQLKDGQFGAAVRMCVYAGICWAGVIFWLYWNNHWYGDALKFAHWTYSVASTDVREYLSVRPQNVFGIFGKAVLIIFGPALVLSSIWMFVRIRHLRLDWKFTMLLVFFGLPALFALLAVLKGFVLVDKWWWNWRYVLPAGLFIAITGALGFSELFRVTRSKLIRGGAILSLVAMPVAQMLLPTIGVATYKDARKGFYDLTWHGTPMGAKIRNVYEDGSVALLTGYGQAQRIMLASGLPLRTFHILYDPSRQEFLEPSLGFDRYIVIGKDRTPESDQIVGYWLSRRKMLLEYYAIILENEHYILLDRLPGVEIPVNKSPRQKP